MYQASREHALLEANAKAEVNGRGKISHPTPL